MCKNVRLGWCAVVCELPDRVPATSSLACRSTSATHSQSSPALLDSRVFPGRGPPAALRPGTLPPRTPKRPLQALLSVTLLPGQQPAHSHLPVANPSPPRHTCSTSASGSLHGPMLLV